MSPTDLRLTVDRRSHVPLYHQVAEQIQEAIGSGDLPPGARLDNEIALADRLGLSRPTMRRAIQELVDKGLLVRKRGVGTQVVPGRVQRELALTSLHDDLATTGRCPTTRVLTNQVVEATAEIAAELGVEAGTSLRLLERIRLADGEPLAVLRNWLPVDLIEPSDTDLVDHGLYELMRTTGRHLSVARQRIGARGADAAEARALGLRKGAPVLTMQRSAYDDSGRAIEYGDHCYRPDAYSFEVTLVER